MIFVTVGTSLPFDRLVRAADALAPDLPETPFFAQIGSGAYVPSHMAFAAMLALPEYTELMQGARLIIAHAGMGSLITAIEAGKPIVIVPRRVAYDEINTDHQLATAKRWVGKRGVHVAMDEAALGEAVRSALTEADSGQPLTPTPGFLDKIRSLVERG